MFRQLKPLERIILFACIPLTIPPHFMINYPGYGYCDFDQFICLVEFTQIKGFNSPCLKVEHYLNN